MLKQKTDEVVIVTACYMIGSVMVFLSLYMFYTKKWSNRAAYGVQIYLALRGAVRVMDFEDTKQFMSEERWELALVIQLTGLIVSISMFFSCFPLTKVHMAVTASLFSFVIIAFMCGIIGMNYLIENPAYFFKNVSVLVPFGAIYTTLHFYLLARLNTMLIEGMFEKL